MFEGLRFLSVSRSALHIVHTLYRFLCWQEPCQVSIRLKLGQSLLPTEYPSYVLNEGSGRQTNETTNRVALRRNSDANLGRIGSTEDPWIHECCLSPKSCCLPPAWLVDSSSSRHTHRHEAMIGVIEAKCFLTCCIKERFIN